MRGLLRTIATLLSLAMTAAWATPNFHDGNDLWIVPEESGWGLNLFHQGEMLFGSLFVYGPDGRARWYTASSLMGGFATDRPAVFSGPLYESTGPAIGTPFDPARVTRRQVGTMSVELGSQKLATDTRFRNYAIVNYSIDGVQVSKVAYPFSFVAMGLTGNYTGYVGATATNFGVVLNNGSFSMTTITPAGSCNYSGRQEPDGSLFHVEGTYACSNGDSGSFTMTNVDVTRHGFTATSSRGDMVAQRVSNAIRGDGYATDLWWVPAESGWGLNLIEQGDILFGTLFVYDAAGQPHWYSASELAYGQCAPPDAASDCYARYTGAIYESTGPYFGTSFNASAVNRRQVGSMKLDMYGNNTAYLDYTIDGITVTRKALSRAAFRTNSLAGTYVGHMLALFNSNDRGVQLGAMTIDVAESGDAITVTMRGTRGTCTMRGTRTQYGRQVMALGAYDCGGAAIGQLQLADLYPTWSGFTGSVSLDGYPIGRIEGVRTGAH
jgi:hypothetical protein